jgi:hypothetical protein
VSDYLGTGIFGPPIGKSGVPPMALTHSTIARKKRQRAVHLAEQALEEVVIVISRRLMR